MKTIPIHGNNYVPVSERVKEAHANKEITLTRILTEVLQSEPVVVIKATVELENSTTKKIFTGISSANPAKSIEKANPYEVAETSAVGRALGFAGYGIDEGIASADEMVKSTTPPVLETDTDQSGRVNEQEENFCKVHNIQMKERFKSDGSTWFDHRHQVNGEWETCYGKGYPSENQIPERDVNDY